MSTGTKVMKSKTTKLSKLREMGRMMGKSEKKKRLEIKRTVSHRCRTSSFEKGRLYGSFPSVRQHRRRHRRALYTQLTPV
jgi:hypothetical protein